MSDTTAGALWLFAIATILATPSIVQRARHNRVRRQLRADLMREATRKLGQDRDYWRTRPDHYERLYHEGVAAQAILLAKTSGPITEDTPMFDRACLAWLDKATDWDDAS